MLDTKKTALISFIWGGLYTWYERFSEYTEDIWLSTIEATESILEKITYSPEVVSDFLSTLNSDDLQPLTIGFLATLWFLGSFSSITSRSNEKIKERKEAKLLKKHLDIYWERLKAIKWKWVWDYSQTKWKPLPYIKKEVNIDVKDNVITLTIFWKDFIHNGKKYNDVTITWKWKFENDTLVYLNYEWNIPHVIQKWNMILNFSADWITIDWTFHWIAPKDKSVTLLWRFKGFKKIK